MDRRPHLGGHDRRPPVCGDRTVDVLTVEDPDPTNRVGRVLEVGFHIFPFNQVHHGQPRLVSVDGHDGIWSVTAVVGSCPAASGAFRPAGSVAGVSFAPDTPPTSGAQYEVLVNPSGSLGVTDLAGNPAHKVGFDVTIP